jgi:hypothetical protein
VRYSLRKICRRKPVDSLNEVRSLKTRMSCVQGEHGMPTTYGAKARVAPERRQLSQRDGELGSRDNELLSGHGQADMADILATLSI